MKISVVAPILLAAIATAFAHTGCDDGPSDVCSALGSASGCNSDAPRECRDAIAMAKQADPTCAALVDALAECIAGLDLSCTGPGSIAANGDGMFDGGQNFTMIGDATVVVNDTGCDEHRRGLEACRTCPDAVGATTVDVLGVGDRCDGGTACADGLTCTGGICTRPCADDDACKARADGCNLQSQYPNVCGADGMCTRSCGSDYSCAAWIGDGSTCVDGACTRT